MKKGFFHELKKNKVLFLMLLPALIFFAINSYIPMVGIYSAFTRYEFTKGIFRSPFIGMQNFEFLWKSNILLKLTLNTVLYNLVFIIIGNILQIFIAILISYIMFKLYRRLTQSLIFFPYFVSFVLIGVLAYNLLNFETGAFNTLLKTLHLPPIDFYNKPIYWPLIITLAYLWKFLGYGTIIYLASIVTINDEYYEAAEIDGANIFQQIYYITIPHLIPTMTILFLLSLGQIMRGQFDLFYNLIGRNGNLFNVTDILDTYVYRSVKTNIDIGIGTAAGLYQSVFGFIIVMISNYLIKKHNEDYSLF
jgi:putative aldouronate transport system permease protein